jgi:hypothetical protein
MPRVPTYDEFQVQDRALPGARQESVSSPALFGTAGQNIKGLGEAVQGATGTAAIVAARMQERDNADRIFAAETALKDDLIKFTTEQRNKRGAAALADGGVTQQTEQWFGEALQRHSGVLTNDRQRQLFTQAAAKLRLQTVQAMSLHQAQEARTSVVDSANASIVGSINLAAANANDWTVAESSAKDIRARVAVLAGVNGWDDTVRDGVVGEKLTQLHKQMIEQLVKTNPAGAKAYYDKYEKEIDGSQRAELGEFARKATATSVGDGVADTIWKSMGPKNSSDAVPLADMEERVRTELKGNEDAIAQGLKGLKERVQAHDYQKKSQGAALEASVNGLILNGKFSRSAPEFLQLSAKDPEAARKVLTFVENQAYTQEARAAAREQRADAAESRRERKLNREGLETALRVSNPDTLVSMSRDEVINLLPTLGRENTAALVAKWDALTKSEAKLIDARIDKQDFDTIALEAGFRPNEPKKDEAEKDRLVRLQARVEQVIDAEQRAAGNKPLTREAKQSIMRREIDNAVMVDRTWPIPNQSRPAATLTPDEAKDAFVLVGPTEQQVKLAEIPATYRVRVIGERKKQGLRTTEAQLAELWLRSTGKFKDK